MRQNTLNAEIYEAASLADASGYIAVLCFLHEEAVNNPGERLAAHFSNGVDNHLAVGQAVEELLAVAFRADAGIEDDDLAGVGAAADQATEALLQFDDRFGERVFKERFASARFDRFHASFLQRLVGDGERQLGDDHVLQSVAGDIDSLPEAVGSKQDSARIGAKTVEQHRALQAGSLAKQRVVLRGKPRRQPVCTGLQQLVTGEEHEGSTGSGGDVVFDLLAELHAALPRSRPATHDAA